jgi:hypothetical protein
MLAEFDGFDDDRQVSEATELRYRHGMSYHAVPLAFRIDNEWQVWWRDAERQAWFYRRSLVDVVQIPFNVVL